ncbi:MAG: hypothetical protein ACW99G_13930 [Candidatus Thorarchaeota archaeon]|jgi:hypothetical protein
MIGSFIRNAPFGTEIAFAKGLLELGIDVATWDPSRNGTNHWHEAPDAVIMFKDHGEKAHQAIRLNKAKGAIAIEYQPDDIRAPGIKGMMKDLLGLCDYAFTFDESGAAVAEDLGYKKAMKLLVTADPEIYRPLDEEKHWDFCFIGSMSHPTSHASRRKMIDILHNAGYKVYVGNTFDPIEINRMYNQSKVVINHATDVGQPFGHGYGYQCRHFEAGMSGAAFLSNCLLDKDHDGPSYFTAFFGEDDLLRSAKVALDNYVTNGKRYHEHIMRVHRPKDRAEEIIEFIEEIQDEA